MTDTSPQVISYAPPHLELDLWTPSGEAKGLVVHAHGGGFVHGSRHDRIAKVYGPLLSGAGIAFASISYRKGGAPRRAFDAEMQAVIAGAAEQSAAFFPEVRADLFGPALYRASADFRRAARFLQQTGFGGVPWVAIGNSSGALAAIGAAHGLQKLEGTDMVPPRAVIGIASLVPQPWMIASNGPPISLLCARGDQVFPRAAINRLEDHAAANGLPVTVMRIPFGQHTRPVREVLPQADGGLGQYGDWLMKTVGTALGAGG